MYVNFVVVAQLLGVEVFVVIVVVLALVVDFREILMTSRPELARLNAQYLQFYCKINILNI